MRSRRWERWSVEVVRGCEVHGNVAVTRGLEALGWPELLLHGIPEDDGPERMRLSERDVEGLLRQVACEVVAGALGVGCCWEVPLDGGLTTMACRLEPPGAVPLPGHVPPGRYASVVWSPVVPFVSPRSTLPGAVAARVGRLGPLEREGSAALGWAGAWGPAVARSSELARRVGLDRALELRHVEQQAREGFGLLTSFAAACGELALHDAAIEVALGDLEVIAAAHELLTGRPAPRPCEPARDAAATVLAASHLAWALADLDGLDGRPCPLPDSAVGRRVADVARWFATLVDALVLPERAHVTAVANPAVREVLELGWSTPLADAPEPARRFERLAEELGVTCAAMGVGWLDVDAVAAALPAPASGAQRRALASRLRAAGHLALALDAGLAGSAEEPARRGLRALLRPWRPVTGASSGRGRRP